MTILPQIRQATLYPGQMGVWGSDVPRGLRWGSAGIVLYVNNIHPEGHDDNDGTNPEAPLETIQQAVDNLAGWETRYTAAGSLSGVGSVIVVAPGTYNEDVTVTRGTAPDYCTIMGGGNGKYPVIWGPADGDCLAISAYGWRVEGIHFQPGDSGAGVNLTRPAGAGAEGTVIWECFFNGGWGTGLYGVELNGAPANVSILNCRFAEFDAASPCITVTATGTADPYQTHILGCTFQESAEYITSVAGGWNASIIKYNTFAAATPDLAATTTYINLGNGSLGYNVVTQNTLGGLYTNAGGYTAEAGGLDNWNGNYAADMAPAQVSVSGLTIAEPA